jgi:hypothetical protein
MYDLYKVRGKNHVMSFCVTMMLQCFSLEKSFSRVCLGYTTPSVVIVDF